MAISINSRKVNKNSKEITKKTDWKELKHEINIGIINKKPVFYVYELIDPKNNGVFYVGKGTKGRHWVHESLARCNKHYNKHLESKIHQIWKSGGIVIKNFLLKTDDEEEAFKLEKETIDNIGLENLCNVESGDRHRYKGYEHSDETKKKLVKSNRSKEKKIRDKISRSNIRRFEDSNERKKLSDAVKRSMTIEVRRKMSEAKKGKRPHNYNKVKRICTNCGISFLTSPSHKRKFCSRECMNTFNRKIITCKKCNIKLSVRKSSKQKYCSLKCATSHRWIKYGGSWRKHVNNSTK